MVMNGAPAHAPAAAAGTAPGAKPSTASEGLLARLATSGGAFTADDITFSVRTMLDENAHALNVRRDLIFATSCRTQSDLGGCTDSVPDALPARQTTRLCCWHACALVWIATSFRPRPRKHKHANASLQLHTLCAIHTASRSPALASCAATVRPVYDQVQEGRLWSCTAPHISLQDGRGASCRGSPGGRCVVQYTTRPVDPPATVRKTTRADAGACEAREARRGRETWRLRLLPHACPPRASPSAHSDASLSTSTQRRRPHRESHLPRGEYRAQTGIWRLLSFVSVRTIKGRSIDHAAEANLNASRFCLHGGSCPTPPSCTTAACIPHHLCV